MKILVLLYLCFMVFPGAAQEVPVTTQQQLENLGDENLEDDALLQQLAFFRKHPINLNTANVDELQALRFLNELQIASFIRYRNLFGKLIDLYELQAVPGFDLLTIQKILPYITIGASTSISEALLSRFRGGDQYLLFRFARTMERAKGYDTSLTTHYAGDPNRFMFRYRYQYKNTLYYGVVADKDAGEPFGKGAQKLGFDFYSVHFFARNLGFIKSFALGDYTLNLGQGLIQWQSMGFGKSAEVLNIKRQSPVLMPYRSGGEIYFNRGLAMTIGVNKWEATAFFSYKNVTGNLAEDSAKYFTSFGTSGYHRTKNELADRHRITNMSYGGSISFRIENFKAGLNAVAHQFSLPMKRKAEPYNFFSFYGRQSVNTSIDYSYSYRNMHLFGEAALDRNFNSAVIQGLLLSADKKVDISLLYRRISKSYQSLFGNAFTENTLPVNENGIYAGLLVKPAIGWQVAAYADFYRFPFIKYRVSAPSRGWDYLLQLSYMPSKRSEIYLRFRTENKPGDKSGVDRIIELPEDQGKQNLRLHFTMQINPVYTIKGRGEINWVGKEGESRQEGFLSFIELAAHPLSKFKANLRLQFFETGGYESRIYSYESDVLYAFSIPAFYDKGFRYYLNTTYSVTPKLRLWMRIAQTFYQNKTSVGSGLDETSGNKRTEVKMQATYDF